LSVPAEAGRWELLRALGAVSAAAPPANGPLTDAVGLPRWDAAEHTRVFVLDLPPYASIHLGAEGKLGGVGADRVAGVWRALGLGPPAGADHLAALLALYAHVGQATDSCTTDRARRRLQHVRRVLLWEHLWSWLPGYLAAAAGPAGSERGTAGARATSTAPYGSGPGSGPGSGAPAAAWATLTMEVLCREAGITPAPVGLPSALRHAPPALHADVPVDELLDALTAPVRVGFVLTHSDIARAGHDIGVGVRRGERRFALRAMLEQDPHATLEWLAGHARRWAGVHRRHPPLGAGTSRWWSDRADASARALHMLIGRRRADRAAPAAPAPDW
jgi:hypothetical protein